MYILVYILYNLFVAIVSDSTTTYNNETRQDPAKSTSELQSEFLYKYEVH